MSKMESISFKLDKNLKIIEELKQKRTQKREEISIIESSDFGAIVEEKKKALLKLQEIHKRELDLIREKHRAEREVAMTEYLGSKTKKETSVEAAKKELKEIEDKLQAVKKDNRSLHKEKHKLKVLGEVQITSHAIVQYLNRAKGVNVDELRKEFADKYSHASVDEVKDHMLVDYLVSENRIDLKEVESDILPESVKKLITASELAGSTGVFGTNDGFRLAVSGGKVVTFLPKKEKIKTKREKKFKELEL